jgi:hypothetical protein
MVMRGAKRGITKVVTHVQSRVAAERGQAGGHQESMRPKPDERQLRYAERARAWCAQLKELVTGADELSTDRTKWLVTSAVPSPDDAARGVQPEQALARYTPMSPRVRQPLRGEHARPAAAPAPHRPFSTREGNGCCVTARRAPCTTLRRVARRGPAAHNSISVTTTPSQ